MRRTLCERQREREDETRVYSNPETIKIWMRILCVRCAYVESEIDCSFRQKENIRWKLISGNIHLNLCVVSSRATDNNNNYKERTQQEFPFLWQQGGKVEEIF